MYVHFPDPLSSSDMVKVYIMIYEDQDFERIPLRLTLLDQGYAPSDWRCHYDDLTDGGKIGYTLLTKLFPKETIVILTESEPNNE